jgi:serine protease Do
MKIHRILPAGVLLAFLWAVPTAARAQGNLADFLRTNPKFLQAFREVVAGPSEYTVRVRCDGKDTALGVIVGTDGWVLTKAFDIKGAITCRLKDGRELEAKVVGVHQPHDLAMLKVEAGGLPVAHFKASKAVPAGTWVASPGPGEDPVAVGVVSVPTRTVQHKGLAIAASDLSKIGYLGVALEPAAGQGVRVAHVMPGTAASKAGLKVSDVILSVSGVTVNDPEEFQSEMSKRRPGDQISLHVRRGEQELDLDATLQQRPPGDNRSDIQNHMGSELSARRSGYGTILTHDSVVRPADCGGPLVDLDGNVIGINISRAGRTESWAIPTEVIEVVLADLKSGKLAPNLTAAAPPGSGTGSLSQPERPDASRRGEPEPKSPLSQPPRHANPPGSPRSETAASPSPAAERTPAMPLKP